VGKHAINFGRVNGTRVFTCALHGMMLGIQIACFATQIAGTFPFHRTGRSFQGFDFGQPLLLLFGEVFVLTVIVISNRQHLTFEITFLSESEPTTTLLPVWSTMANGNEDGAVQ